MIPTRLLAVALLLLPGFAPAQAQGKETFTLRAAIGGSVPYARKESFVLANIAGNPKGQKITLSSSIPQPAMAHSVFDARPQVVINGGVSLGSIGSAPLLLSAHISAGVMRAAEDEPRPLLGFAALRLLF